MKTTPQIAVMMPVYNGEKTVQMAVLSLLAQTYRHWHCYVVNDGSTDNTKGLLDQLQDRRFTVIHLSKNRGRAVARQKALEAAQGDYLAFLDADDFYHREKLERQVHILDNHRDIDLVSCRMGSFDTDYHLRNVRPKTAMNTPIVFDGRRELRISKAPSMIRLARAKNFKYDPALVYAEDTDFLARYLKGRSYWITDDLLYYYAEFESQNAQKIIDTYTYKRKRIAKTLKDHLFWAVLRLIKVDLARFRMHCTLRLKGVDYVIDQRGDPPDKADKNRFKKTVQSLHKAAGMSPDHPGCPLR